MGLIDDIRNESSSKGGWIGKILQEFESEQDRQDFLDAIGDKSISVTAIVKVLHARGISSVTRDRIYNYRRNLP